MGVQGNSYKLGRQ